jgi:hypothetical protein
MSVPSMCSCFIQHPSIRIYSNLDIKNYEISKLLFKEYELWSNGIEDLARKESGK